MVPHSRILECLTLVEAADNVIGLIKRSMKSWQTELTAGGEILGSMNINRGIFQEDSLSLLLFVICMTPITKALNKMKAGYIMAGGDLKINHLFFMDDLKLYSKHEREIDGPLSSVKLLSNGHLHGVWN